MNALRIVFLIGCLLCVRGPLEAGKPGSSTANFLKLGVGARPVAMGEAYTAVANDIYATMWNPAGLARLTAPEVGLMHAELVEGLKYEFVGIALPKIWRGNLAVSGLYFTTGKIEGFDSTGRSLGTLPRSFDAAGSLSYGLPVGDRIALGVTGRYLYRRLVSQSVKAFIADVGLQYRTPLQGLSLGGVVQHLGPNVKFVEDSDPLPRTIKVGAAYPYRWALLAVDGHFQRDQSPFVTVGIELQPLSWVALRGGWKTKDDVGPGFRVGAGFTWKQRLSVDYAFLPFSPFGDTHRASLTLRWNK